MKNKLVCFSAVAASCAFAFCGCGTQLKARSYSTFVFATPAELRVIGNFEDEDIMAAGEKLSGDYKAYLRSLEASLSAYKDGTCLYNFNAAAAGEKVKIDYETYSVLSIAKTAYEFTEGYYNPAVLQTVKLYGFSDESWVTKTTLPTETAVEALSALPEYFKDIELLQEGGEYYAVKPTGAFVEYESATIPMAIDVSGVAKGYAADKIDKMAEDAGFKYGFFDFGGSSYTVNKSYSGRANKWTMNIVNPRGAGTVAEFKISDEALSTSGDYIKYFVVDGVRYSHIINPFTGKPTQSGIASVTVVGENAAMDDAITTAISCMDVEKAVSFVKEKLKDRKVAFIHLSENGKKFYTNAAEYFTVSADGYEKIIIE